MTNDEAFNLIEKHELRLVRRVNSTSGIGYEWVVYNSKGTGTNPNLKIAILQCIEEEVLV